MRAAYKAELVRDWEAWYQSRKAELLETEYFPSLAAALDWLSPRLSETLSGYIYERNVAGDWEAVADLHN